MSNFVAVLALIVAGTMVGVEIAVALVTPLFERLPGDAGLRARAESARRMGRIMPAWYVASVVLAGAVVVTRWDSGAAPAILAVALFFVSIVLSVAVLVPINTRVQGWTTHVNLGDGRAGADEVRAGTLGRDHVDLTDGLDRRPARWRSRVLLDQPRAVADWTSQLRRWDAVHRVRVGVILAGLGLLAVAVVR